VKLKKHLYNINLTTTLSSPSRLYIFMLALNHLFSVELGDWYVKHVYMSYLGGMLAVDQLLSVSIIIIS